MAKQQENTDLDLGEVYSKTELFIEKNKKPLAGVVVALVAVIAAVVFYNNWKTGQNVEAAESMWKAEYYFQVDSLDLALNGDNNHLGFLEIADAYGSTPTGGLAKYYIGAIYMKKADFNSALQYYEEADIDDDILSVMRIGGMGDAHIELGNAAKAADLFKKAAEMRTNDFTTPMYLMKAGFAYQQLGQFKDAAAAFQRVADEFPLYGEAATAKKYAALYNQL